MLEPAATLLVDPTGAVLLQLRDGDAPRYPDVWCLPGGAVEPGETPTEAAVRELHEETGLRPDVPLRYFGGQDLPIPAHIDYFWAPAGATQADVVLGEGAAMLFIPAAELLDRPSTPGTAEIIEQFLTSPASAR
jgi:8-oxo-dGTP diphosphatase